MPIPDEQQHILVANPETLGGAVRFKGTRVPVQALIHTLDGGDIDEFLDGWSNVPREHAEAVGYWLKDQSIQSPFEWR